MDGSTVPAILATYGRSGISLAADNSRLVDRVKTTVCLAARPYSDGRSVIETEFSKVPSFGARSRSIGHLNLSQPLGSSAAHAGAAPSNTNTTRQDLRMINPLQS
jgi:hypothetical protein